MLGHMQHCLWYTGHKDGPNATYHLGHFDRDISSGTSFCIWNIHRVWHVSINTQVIPTVKSHQWFWGYFGHVFELQQQRGYYFNTWPKQTFFKAATGKWSKHETSLRPKPTEVLTWDTTEHLSLTDDSGSQLCVFVPWGVWLSQSPVGPKRIPGTATQA